MKTTLATLIIVSGAFVVPVSASEQPLIWRPGTHMGNAAGSPATPSILSGTTRSSPATGSGYCPKCPKRQFCCPVERLEKVDHREQTVAGMDYDPFKLDNYDPFGQD